MSADHYLFSTKFANCNSHLFANLVLLLFWKLWIQLLLDPAFIVVLISLWSNPFKVCFPNFFTAAVKVEVFSTRLKASPEFVNCGGEKFCTRHFLLWQGDVKWPLRSASALTWYHTSYGSPQILPFFLCPFFTQSSWPCHSSLLSIVIKPSKTQGSWFLMMMGLVMTLKLMILYRAMSGKVSSGGHCVLHYCRPVLHWSFPGQ